jgi:hypothetical protein
LAPPLLDPSARSRCLDEISFEHKTQTYPWYHKSPRNTLGLSGCSSRPPSSHCDRSAVRSTLAREKARAILKPRPRALPPPDPGPLIQNPHRRCNGAEVVGEHARRGARNLSLGSLRSLGVAVVTVLWPIPLIPATDTVRDLSDPSPHVRCRLFTSEYRRLHWR